MATPKHTAAMLLLILAPSLLVHLAAAQDEKAADSNIKIAPPPPPPAGWQRGRSSWYGTPKQFVAPFISSRGGGESAFGILEWGGCGYTNADGSMPYPKDAVSSYGDVNPDSAGSCGRCYEIKCAQGLVVGPKDVPVDYVHYYYYPQFGSAKDDLNRTFPGNPAESQHVVYVKCWDPNKSIRVHIVDICPCIYSPKGQTPYIQASCCYKNSDHPKSGQIEFDLSFWAYEQLAHPMYPEMMLDFRPVDCSTGAALPFLPGYINKEVLYDEMVTTGWSWFPYMTPTHNFNVTAQGWGRGGSTAACAEISPGGGMTWLCRNCSRPGLQPFAGTTSINFWLRDRYKPGNIPPLKVVIGNADTNKYCDSEVYLNSFGPNNKEADGWLGWQVPFNQWNCNRNGAENMDQISFLNIGSANTWFCLDDLKLVHGPQK